MRVIGLPCFVSFLREQGLPDTCQVKFYYISFINTKTNPKRELTLIMPRCHESSLILCSIASARTHPVCCYPVEFDDDCVLKQSGQGSGEVVER